MRSLVLFLVGMLVGACGTHTSTLPPVYAPALESHVDGIGTLREVTVALVALNDEGNARAYCTGIWVSPRSILTAAHCMRDDVPLVLYVTSDDVYPHGLAEAHPIKMRAAEKLASDEDHDLALVRALAPPSGHGIARTRVAPIVQGMFVQTMGHPLGLWYSYSSGEVSAVRDKDLDDGKKLWLQTTAPISPGNSGGGLFDEDEALIGVCHGSYTRGQELNLFVHVDYIDALLRAKSREGVL